MKMAIKEIFCFVSYSMCQFPWYVETFLACHSKFKPKEIPDETALRCMTLSSELLWRKMERRPDSERSSSYTFLDN
jgi:hypothetical protein